MQIIKAASNSITQAFEGINHTISALARIGRMADNELKVTEATQKLEGIAQIKLLAKETDTSEKEIAKLLASL